MSNTRVLIHIWEFAALSFHFFLVTVDHQAEEGMDGWPPYRTVLEDT